MYLDDPHHTWKQINIEYNYLNEKDKVKLYNSVKMVIWPRLFNILKEGREWKNFIRHVSDIESDIKNRYSMENLDEFIEKYCQMLNEKIQVQKNFAAILEDISAWREDQYNVDGLYRLLKESLNNEIIFFAYSWLLKYFCEMITNYFSKIGRKVPENMISKPKDKTFFLEFNQNLKGFLEGEITKKEIIDDFFNGEESFLHAFLSESDINNPSDFDMGSDDRKKENAIDYDDKNIEYINQLLTIDNVLEKYVQFKKVFLHDLMLYYYIKNGNIVDITDEKLGNALDEIFKLDRVNQETVENHKEFGLMTFNEILGMPDSSFWTKGLNISILKNNGFLVPNGFILLDDLIDRVKNWSIRQEEQEKISNYIRLKLGNNLIIRSNFLWEDWSDKSYAWMFNSYIRIKPEDIFFYVNKVIQPNNLSEVYCKEEMKPGVIIQEFIEWNFSGVWFVQNKNNKIIIEMVKWINENLVSGKCSPTSLIIDIDDWNRWWVEFNLPIKVDDLIEKLKHISKTFNDDVDVEFTIKNDEIYILQTRSITKNIDVTENNTVKVPQIPQSKIAKLVSKWDFEGKIFIIENEDDIKTIDNECIVITNNLYPSLTLKLSFIRGIVSEEWAYLAHLSIVARELGIPAIINIDNMIHEVKSKGYSRIKMINNALEFY